MAAVVPVLSPSPPPPQAATIPLMHSAMPARSARMDAESVMWGLLQSGKQNYEHDSPGQRQIFVTQRTRTQQRRDPMSMPGRRQWLPRTPNTENFKQNMDYPSVGWSLFAIDFEALATSPIGTAASRLSLGLSHWPRRCGLPGEHWRYADLPVTSAVNPMGRWAGLGCAIRARMASMTAPCPVKACGSLRRPPHLDVTDCDIKFSNSSAISHLAIELEVAICDLKRSGWQIRGRLSHAATGAKGAASVCIATIESLSGGPWRSERLREP